MESLLVKAERAYKILGKKLENLNSQLAYCSGEKREMIESEIDQLNQEYEKLRFIYLGKKMEQAGRDLWRAAKNLKDLPGELDMILGAIKHSKSDENIMELFDQDQSKKDQASFLVEEALEKINDTYYLLFDREEEEDDDDDEPGEFPDPHRDPPDGEKKLLLYPKNK